MSAQQQLQMLAFQQAIARERLGGPTKQYLGWTKDLFRNGTIRKWPAIGSLKLQQTKKTWRGCHACRRTRYTAVFHTSGQMTLRKCISCKGQGVVFG